MLSVYDVETDEETDMNSNAPHIDALQLDASQAIGDIFKDKSFYLSSNVGAVEEIKLRRIIDDHTGSLCAKSSSADYIISNESYQSESTKGSIVKPVWVYESAHMNCLLPVDRYKP